MEQVSLLQLIATPDRFDNKLVSVIGFVRLEFEGNAIYLHKDDYEIFNTKNALWLSGVSRNLNKGPRAVKNDLKYMQVEGLFRAGHKGHMGMYSGTLEAQSIFENWQELIRGIRQSAK